MNPLKISFPHMGDYHLPISGLLEELFPNAEILPPPPTTQKTVELGARSSPDFVCSPFKYNMGNFIQALESGANVLFQTGMGCRYGYYGEVQEQILKDMGYEFEFVCLSRGGARPLAAFQSCKRLNPNLTVVAALKALLLAVERIRVMDRLDYILRERIGFEAQSGSFEREKKQMLGELMRSGTVPEMSRIFRKYRDIYYSIDVNMPKSILRVGIIGELFTLMDPFSNHYLEKQLAKSGIAVSRKMSVSFLLFGKNDRKTLGKTGGYLQHTVGANGIDSVAQCRQYARKGYDGILHIKSFGCTPELNAQPALMNISRDMDIPILHLSFDTQTSETGVQTRLEAFADMIKMKRERDYEKSSQPGSGRGLYFHQRRFY